MRAPKSESRLRAHRRGSAALSLSLTRPHTKRGKGTRRSTELCRSRQATPGSPCRPTRTGRGAEEAKGEEERERERIGRGTAYNTSGAPRPPGARRLTSSRRRRRRVGALTCGAGTRPARAEEERESAPRATRGKWAGRGRGRGGRTTSMAWSRSYGSSVSCSLGLKLSLWSFLTSAAKTASAGAVESMHDALIEMTAWPPFLRKWCALRATMRAWSGCATSAKTTSTIERSMRYLFGWRASSTMAVARGEEARQYERDEAGIESERERERERGDARMTLVRFLAMLTRSRPERCENSTA